jgi:hypothetical protein
MRLEIEKQMVDSMQIEMSNAAAKRSCCCQSTCKQYHNDLYGGKGWSGLQKER